MDSKKFISVTTNYRQDVIEANIELVDSRPSTVVSCTALSNKAAEVFYFFTARCYASAVLAMALCLSVRPSLVGVLLKRLNVGLHKQHHMIAQGL